jgi:O-antigen ligase
VHKSIVFWGLCAVLVFVPLPIGSVQEWAIFVFEAATLALFLIYVGGELLARRRGAPGIGEGFSGKTRFSGPPESGFRARGEEDWNGAGPEIGGASEAIPRAVKVLLAVFLVASVIQILPLPPVAVKILSPRAAAIFQEMARDGLGGWNGRAWWTLSLAPGLSAGKLILMVCYGIFGFLVLRTARGRRRLEIFVLVMIGSAFFQAIYGMAETFSWSERIFGLQKKYNIGSVTGTYINRNHFAGFMEMAFPLTLGYLLARARYFLMDKGLGWRQRFLWFSQESLQWSLLVGLGSVFIGIALVFSKSRSGIMIFLVTVLLAAGALGSWRELSDRADERKRARGILRLVVAAVLAVALWLGIGPVIERFGEMDISKEARRTFVANTVRMTGDFLWAGAGKGTYVDVYPMYKKIDDGYQLSYAHNDYLEVTAENGVVAGGCLIVAGLWLFVVLAGRWRKRRANFAKGIGLGAILGILAILIHGFTDFNLQIPANAVYFVGLCALATNVVTKRKEREGSGANASSAVSSSVGGNAVKREAVDEGGRRDKRGESTGGGSGGRAITSAGWTSGARPWKTAVMGIAAFALLVVATRDFLGFHYLGLYRDARSRARSVQSAFPELEGLLKKAAGEAGNPEIGKTLGQLYLDMARVENEAGNAERRDMYCDRAVAAYAAVIAENPCDSAAHYEMGMTYLLYNYPLMTYADKAKLYFRQALELNPVDEFLNLNILYFYLTAWDGLDDAEKDYAGGRLKKIRAADPAFMPQLEQRWKQQFGSTAKLEEILKIGVGPI